MEHQIPVSVLILTLNEESNLPRCFKALSWCDDIVVLDSCSTDRTVKIAGEFGARVFQREFDNFALQRNHALENIEFRHDWIFHLDADEVFVDALKSEIRKVIESSHYDAYRVPSRTMFMGKWLRYSGMYPTYQVRLSRKDRFSFKQVGHGQKENIDPIRIGTLDQPYLHYSFSKGIGEWFEKHNRYASAEAGETLKHLQKNRIDWRSVISLDPVRRRSALKALSYRLPFRPFFRFVYMYVLRRGFLDGSAGLTYCLLLAVYEYMIVLKIREIRRLQEGLPL